MEAMQVQQDNKSVPSQSSESYETPEQDRKMPAVVVDTASAGQEMMHKITSHLDGFDIKLERLNTSLTDLSTSANYLKMVRACSNCKNYMY